jgi:diazepam-binding inhibitor (GABA receptor modulating acyl-CoA-binding protein)
MSLKDDFDAAVARVNGLAKAPSPGDMLELYGLFKQATKGDASGSRPGMLDVKGRAKFDAWAGKKGMSSDDAMRGYLAAATRLGA